MICCYSCWNLECCKKVKKCKTCGPDGISAEITTKAHTKLLVPLSILFIITFRYSYVSNKLMLVFIFVCLNLNSSEQTDDCSARW